MAESAHARKFDNSLALQRPEFTDACPGRTAVKGCVGLNVEQDYPTGLQGSVII